MPVVVGGIIPSADADALREAGVARVYTPKDFDLNRIMGEIADLVSERARSCRPDPPEAEMTQPPRTRYALSGDAHIAYQVFGEGDLDLVFVPGFVSNIEHYWEMPVVPRSPRAPRLVRARRDLRQARAPASPIPSPAPRRLEQRMDDMQAVMDAAGVERAALYGISEGGPASVLFAATYPDRTSALVLYGSTPRFRTDSDIAWGASREQIRGPRRGGLGRLGRRAP